MRNREEVRASSAGRRGSGTFRDNSVAVLVASDHHEALESVRCWTHSTCHLQLATALKPPAREAEPRFGTVIAELGGTQFDNLKRGFDDENHLARRPTRRTDLTRRALGRANEAQPQASGHQRRRDPGGETRALLGFIEDVEAAAVKRTGRDSRAGRW
jgi:hypothetical protein